MKVDFSKYEGSSQLNGIFLPAGLRGMLEAKDYRYWTSYFHFFSGMQILGWDLNTMLG